MPNGNLTQDKDYHVRYLESRLAKLKTNPEINSHQIQATSKFLNFAKNATSYEDYMDKLGEDFDFFPVAKSEQLDRFTNLENFYRELGLKEYIESTSHNKELAENCENYSDLALKLPQGYGSGFQLEKSCQERLNAVANFLSFLVHYSCLGDPKEKSSMRRSIQDEWDKIKSTDPDFNFEALLHKPYNFIHPFDKERLDRLERIFKESE